MPLLYIDRSTLMPLLAALVLAGGAPVPIPAQTGSIEGQVEAAKPRARRVADRYASGGGAVAKIQPLPAVVVLEGAEGAGASTRRHRLAQRDTAFVPAVLVVPPGATVDFPNEDPFFHNVFSYSAVKRFDLGRYPRGESRSVRFDRPGVVRIYCEVHESMRAAVIVTASTHHAVVGEDGRFRIDGVPPGSYTLVLWDPEQGESRMRVTVRAGEVTRLTLAAGGGARNAE